MAGWADQQLFNSDPTYNNMGGSVAWVANSTARTALETSFVINGVITIPNGLIVGDLDTGNIYGWYSVSATWKFLGGTSTVTGAGTNTYLAYWTGTSTLDDTSISFNSATKCLTFPLPPSPGAITGILESTGINMMGFFRGPNWIQMGQAGSTYPSVIYGKSTTPTNDPTLLGGALVSTGYWDVDVDGGVNFLVIPISYGLLTGTGRAWLARDHDADTRFVGCRVYTGVSYPENYVGLKLYSGAMLTGDDGSATRSIIGIESTYPPFTPTVRVGDFNGGASMIPTYIYGGEIYIAASMTPGPGTLTIDVDAGTEFSVLGQATTGGRAFRVRDRVGSPNTYLDCLITTTLGNKGLTFSNGMEIYMGTGVIHGLGAATTAGDAPQLQQIAGRQMVRI